MAFRPRRQKRYERLKEQRNTLEGGITNEQSEHRVGQES